MSSTRQLAAILFADIQGYTALMQDDEVQANLLREKLKKNLEEQVAAHNGRILKLSGDGALCIFNSAIEAVRAAIEVQKEMRSEPKVPLRVGIHTGDVMFEEGDVYGDGVNVASRIESFAVAGGVFISGRVYEDLKNQKDIAAVFLGKFELKNVAAPVEIFAISNDGLVIPEKKMKLEGKGRRDSDKKFQSRNILIGAAVIIITIAGIFFRKNIFDSSGGNSAAAKSIAVLPFQNLSSNKDDEYFADGMCDEILTHISKIADLKVISRTSVLQYKNTTKNLRQIGEELGVNTVLEGTVQKINDRVRINVQLINANTDEHIWAQNYDRDLKDVFAIQTEVAMQIAQELEAKFTDNEKKQIEKIPTNNLDAYNFYIKANALFEDAVYQEDTTKANTAIGLMERAVALDSNFTLAWCKLSEMHGNFFFALSYENFRREYARQALDHAIRLEPDLPEVHLSKGIYSYHIDQNFNNAIREFDVALKDIPNNATILTYKALVLRRQGKWKEALQSIDKAFELSPREIFVAMSRLDLEFAVCNYAEVSRALEHARSIGVNANFYYNTKCQLTMLTRSIQEARVVFDEGRTKTGDGSGTMTFRFRLFNLEGKYSDAINLMLPYADSTVFNNEDYALTYHYLKDDANARKYFERGRINWEKMVKEHPDESFFYCFLGINYAGLGNSEEAIRNLKKAEALIPVEDDAVTGLFPHFFLALCYSLLNNKDGAFAELQFLQQHPGYYSANDPYCIVKPDPIWDNLRSDPRFEKLWEGNALKPEFKL